MIFIMASWNSGLTRSVRLFNEDELREGPECGQTRVVIHLNLLHAPSIVPLVAFALLDQLAPELVSVRDS